MKVAIFGGSFNPIHNAHINLAKRFVNEASLDRVYFVPTFVTPLKDNSSVIPAYHRFRMCELATASYDNFCVSDFEMKKEGVSYSSDTIAYFKKQFPNSEIFFIMGADMFMTLESWHEFQYIFDNVTILTAPRNESDFEDLVKQYEYYQKYSCKAQITQEYIQDLSSTKVRDLIKNSEEVSKFIDNRVLEYIELNGLYR